MIQTWLDNVDPSTLTELGERLEVIQLAPGQLLFNQGDPGDCMYLVVEGRLDVFIDDEEAGQWRVDILKPGDIVGEMALLTGQKRAAKVIAAGATELHRLTRDVFEELCAKDPDLLRASATTWSPSFSARNWWPSATRTWFAYPRTPSNLSCEIRPNR